MPDSFEEAQRHEEGERSAVIAEHQAQHASPAGGWRKLSRKYCKWAECGDRIPDERRRALPGVDVCAACKARTEEQEKRLHR